MDAIVEINAAERLAVVQPGVVNDDLRAAAAEQGLWYPPDPASAPWSTIGGNVATNAGGLCCVKYGVTRDYVLALEVVTAAGEVVRLGRRTAKGVAGYDLVGLMVGSEGTLGVITEVTVRLRPLRTAPMRTVVGFFDTLVRCGRRRRPRHGGRAAARGVRADRPGLPARRQRVEEHGPARGRRRAAARPDRPARTGRRAGGRGDPRLLRGGRRASEAMVSTDPEEAEALFDARRLAYPALLGQHEDAVLTEDVCLPRGKLAEMLARIEEIAGRTTSRSRPSRTRATATCTRAWSPRRATTPAATARSPPSRRSSTPRWTSAAR